MERVLKLFALIIWYKDEPVKGNVLSLTSVKKPRREPEEYTVGDFVMASCPGMKGIFHGVIAKIGSQEEKANLVSVLSDTTKFDELVMEFVPKEPEDVSNLQDVNVVAADHKAPGPVEGDRQKAKKSSNKKPKKQPKVSKEKPVGASNSTQPFPSKSVETAAANLELEELEKTISALSTPLVDYREETSTLVSESLAVVNGAAAPTNFREVDFSMPPPPQGKCAGCLSLETVVQTLQQQAANNENRIASLEGNLKLVVEPVSTDPYSGQ